RQQVRCRAGHGRGELAVGIQEMNGAMPLNFEFLPFAEVYNRRLNRQLWRFHMRRLILLSALLFGFHSSAFATWSILAVDRSTGRVVTASATCVDGDDNRLTYGAAVVVPGVGVAACQAATDGTHQNQTIVFEELQRGTEPRQIIELLSQDPAFQSKQY